MTIRVLLIDDQVMLRQGLRLLLETQPDLQVVGDADRTSNVAQLLAEQQPHVVVTDRMISGVMALDETAPRHTTRDLHEPSPDKRPQTNVVMLVGNEDDAAVVAAVRAGATGVVSTSASIEVLVQAIRAAASGQVAFSTEMSARLVQELRAPVEQPERLTEREHEVLECIADGLSNKEIAWQLRISEKTVKSHVSTILGKLGLESRTQAAMHATRVGLVSVDRSTCSGAHQARAAAVISLDSRRHPPLVRAALS
jgi:DNA-binding NarL/FixJ family response regulator